MESDDRGAAELRARFVAERGFWNATLEQVLAVDAEFFAAYLDLSAVPARTGPLDAKVKELVFVAIDAAATHLDADGLRIHIARALDAGASQAEIVETLQLTATLGIHAANIGVPLLLTALDEAGRRPAPEPLSARQEELKAQFTATRGYWHEFWDGILELDPEFFAAYLAYSAHPWHHGVLEPKVKELIYIAFDAAATHLYVPGLKLHIDNALGYGATAAEVMEVLEIATGLGMKAVTTGIPILMDELARRGIAAD